MERHGLFDLLPSRRSKLQETEKIVKSPEISTRIHELGSEPGTAFGVDFAAFMQAEAKKWGEVIRVSGAKAE